MWMEPSLLQFGKVPSQFTPPADRTRLTGTSKRHGHPGEGGLMPEQKYAPGAAYPSPILSLPLSRDSPRHVAPLLSTFTHMPSTQSPSLNGEDLAGVYFYGGFLGLVLTGAGYGYKSLKWVRTMVRVPSLWFPSDPTVLPTGRSLEHFVGLRSPNCRPESVLHFHLLNILFIFPGRL